MSIFLATAMVHSASVASELLMNNNDCCVVCSRELHCYCDL